MIIFKKIPEKRPYLNSQDDVEIEMKMSGDNTWPDVVQNLLDFLRGCGYVIPYGEFQIIEEEQKDQPQVDQEEYDLEEVYNTTELVGCGPSYCSDCSCGKKEAAEKGEENSQFDGL